MSFTLQIDKMTRDEKLQAIEALWTDLTENSSEVHSPAWHEGALKDTEARYTAGVEKFSDWKSAKTELQDRF